MWGTADEEQLREAMKKADRAQIRELMARRAREQRAPSGAAAPRKRARSTTSWRD